MKINLFRGVIMFSALLIAISIFYYLVIFLPQKEKTRLEIEAANLQLREDCLKGANDKFTAVMQKGGAFISPELYDRLLEANEINKNDCFKRFPENY